MTELVLDCLRKHGQRLDIEIAKDTGLSIADVHLDLEALARAGAVITCRITRFVKGERLEAIQCRMAGHIPPHAPGRKPA